jgi:hypothetical protein
LQSGAGVIGRPTPPTRGQGDGQLHADTPDVSETKLAALKMDELRAHARKLGIDGADELHKPELLAKVKDYHYAQAHGGKHRNGSGASSSIPGHPSAAELSSMKLGELREHARTLGIDGADELHKPELLAKVKDHHAAQAHGGKHRPSGGGASPAGHPSASSRSGAVHSLLRLGTVRRLAVFIVGGVGGYLTRAAAPLWGSTVAGVLLIALVGLAARQRVRLQVRAGW